MAPKDLLKKLEESGTGADKLAKIREVLRTGDDLKGYGDFLDACAKAGVPEGTLAKMRKFIAEAEEDSPKPQPVRETESSAAATSAASTSFATTKAAEVGKTKRGGRKPKKADEPPGGNDAGTAEAGDAEGNEENENETKDDEPPASEE